MKHKNNFSTKVIHTGSYSSSIDNAIFPPIVTSSAFIKKSLDDEPVFSYGRVSNPTRECYEKSMAELEGGVGAVACASGMAATSLVLELLPKDSHIIVVSGAYGGTIRIIEDYRSKTSGFILSHVDLNNYDEIEQNLKENTSLIWIETPTNPLLNLVDLRKVLSYAKEKKILTCVDNTFATPWNQQPISFGADLVMHSASKYIGGHTDLIGGLIVASSQELYNRIRMISMAIGCIQGPFDSYLALRGLKTLDVRMERQCKNAFEVAKWLNQNSAVENVYYPGLENHPHKQICAAQMKTGGAVVTMRIKNKQCDLNKFIEELSLFVLSDSLGGVESMINHSYSMSHNSLSHEHKHSLGICDRLFRLSIGLEDSSDLIKDLDMALKTTK